MYVFAKYFNLSPLTPDVDSDAAWAVGAEHDAGDAEHQLGRANQDVDGADLNLFQFLPIFQILF